MPTVSERRVEVPMFVRVDSNKARVRKQKSWTKTLFNDRKGGAPGPKLHNVRERAIGDPRRDTNSNRKARRKTLWDKNQE